MLKRLLSKSHSKNSRFTRTTSQKPFLFSFLEIIVKAKPTLYLARYELVYQRIYRRKYLSCRLLWKSRRSLSVSRFSRPKKSSIFVISSISDSTEGTEKVPKVPYICPKNFWTLCFPSRKSKIFIDFMPENRRFSNKIDCEAI